MNENPYTRLPQVEKLLGADVLREYIENISRPLVSSVCSQVLESFRRKIGEGSPPPDRNTILNIIRSHCVELEKRRLQRVVNATGIILHTNMGRSPVHSEVWQAAAHINTGYCNLELDLWSGRRGGRGGIIPELIKELTGAESALVVNNNAAAVFLILSVFATGKEVIVSRGEQVQIGGGFRIPEILEETGAVMKEIGTTNITSLEDYRKSINEKTSMVLSVHPSNFVIQGFTRKPSIRAIRSILPDNVILVADQGSGMMTEQIRGEIPISRYLADGADLVCFSCDKVLGGPQAGIILGRKNLIGKLASHPLMRVFRAGKTVYSLIEIFLIEKINKSLTGFTETVLLTGEDEIKKLCRKIIRGLDRTFLDVVPSTMLSGGGSSPEKELPSYSIRISGKKSPETTLAYFRDQVPPIIGTIQEKCVLLNCATLLPEDVDHVKNVLSAFTDEGA